MASPSSLANHSFDETWFYAPLDADGGPQSLPEEEAHHAFSVLRLRSGQDIVVSDGEGCVFRCRLEGDRQKALVTPVIQITAHTERPKASLALALLKGRDCEDPIAAACELALSDVHLLITDHAQVFSGQDHEKLVTRLRQKSVVALKQARKPYLTRIHAPMSLSAWCQAHLDWDWIVAHPGEDKLGPPSAKPFALLVGPEGGFSSGEINALLGATQGLRLSLGETRLRAVHAPAIGLGKLMGLGWF